jgi:hypothetical protein
MNIELLKGEDVIDTAEAGASTSENGFLKGLVPTIASGVLSYPSLRVTNVVANANRLAVKFSAGTLGVHNSTANITSQFRMRPFSVGFKWGSTTAPTDFLAGAAATHTLTEELTITIYNSDGSTPITGHVKESDHVDVQLVLQTGGLNGTSHVNTDITDVEDQTTFVVGELAENKCRFPDDTGECVIAAGSINITRHAGLYYRIDARDATFDTAYAQASNFFRLDPAAFVVKDSAGTAFADGAFPTVIRVDGSVPRFNMPNESAPISLMNLSLMNASDIDTNMDAGTTRILWTRMASHTQSRLNVSPT